MRALVAVLRQYLHCLANAHRGHCAETVRTVRGTSWGCSCGAFFGEAR